MHGRGAHPDDAGTTKCGETLQAASRPFETTYEQAARRRVQYFRGRQEQLEQMQEYFAEDKVGKPRVLILQAMGGQGKSQVALEYCRRSHPMYAHIFWVNAHSEATATHSMEQVAGEVGQNITEMDDPRSKVKATVNALARQSQRWLMVLDRYDDPDGFPIMDEFIPSRKPLPCLGATS